MCVCIYPESLLPMKTISKNKCQKTLSAARLMSTGNQGVEKKLLLQLVQKAAKACVSERLREGDGLKKDVAHHIKELEKCVKKISQLRQRSIKEIRKRFEERLKLLLENYDKEDPRFIQELVLLIEKSDISEEIQRLQTHITAIQKIFQQKGRLGKKLDFFAQELLREINTIGSKSGSAAIAQCVVEAKGAVEKYREQVQNIE